MLSLGTEWLKAILVYYKGKIFPLYSDIEPAVKSYIKDYPDSVNHRIWYSLEKKRCFSQAQYRESIAGKNHHFTIKSGDFLESHWGYEKRLKFLVKNTGNKEYLNQQIITHNDYYYSHHDELFKYKNKKILIIGGGPSTNAVTWENISVDHIWACNHFFLNDKIMNNSQLPDLVSIDGTTDLNHPRLIKFFNKTKALLSFEIERSPKHGQSMNHFLKKNPSVLWNFFNVRYRSVLGILPRMICYAIFLGAKDIYVVGMDGNFKEGTLHSFQKNKQFPKWYIKHGDSFQREQYIIFWDYMLDLEEEYGVTIHNLGEEINFNVSSSITNIYFPRDDNALKAQLC